MSISKNIGVTYISQIGGVFISVLSTIFLSRILGAEGRGEFSVYNNSVTFFNLFIGLSLPSTIIYSVANKRVDENKLLSTLLLYTLVSTVFVILVLQTFFYFNIQSMIFAKDKETMVWKGIFVLHFLSVTFNNLLIAFLNAKRKFMLSSAIGIVNVLIPLLGYLLIYFHLLPMHSEDNYLYAVLFVVSSFVFTTAVLFVFVGRSYTGMFSLQILSKSDIFFVLKFSMIAWMCNFFTSLTYRMDIWFIDHYHGKAATGIYSLAVNLSQFFWVLPNAIGSVLYSYIAKDGLENNLQNIQRLTKYTFYFNVVAGLMSVLLLNTLIPLFYGEAFRGSYVLLMFLLPGVIIFSMPIILASLFAGTGNIMVNLYNTLFSFAICLVLDSIMIRPWSAEGASIASVITYVLSSVFSLYVASRLFKLNIGDILVIKKEDYLFIKSKFIK